MPELDIPDFENIDLAPPQLDPGEYVMNIHEKVTSGTTDDGKPYLVINMKVVDGPDQAAADPNTGQLSSVGRTCRDRVYLTAASQWRLKVLLIAAGVLSRDDKDSAMAKGKINTDMLLGCKVPVKISPQIAPNGREYRNYEYIV